MTSPPPCDPTWPDDPWPDRIHPDLRGQHAPDNANITDIHLEGDYL